MDLDHRIELITEYTGNEIDYRPMHPTMKFLKQITNSIKEGELSYHNVVQLLRVLYCCKKYDWLSYTRATIEQKVVKNPDGPDKNDHHLERVKWKVLNDDYFRHMIPIALIEIENDSSIYFHEYFHKCWPDFLTLLYHSTSECRDKDDNKITDFIYLLPLSIELFKNIAPIARITNLENDLEETVIDRILEIISDIGLFKNGLCLPHNKNSCNRCLSTLQRLRKNLIGIQKTFQL